MPSCVAFGCKHRSVNRPPGTNFHKFPADPLLKKAWIVALRRKDWSPSPTSSLCSAHFLESDFDRTSPFRVYLKKDSVPSVFKAYPKNLQIQKPLLQKRKTFEGAQEKAPKLSENRIATPVLGDVDGSLKLQNTNLVSDLIRRNGTIESGPSIKVTASSDQRLAPSLPSPEDKNVAFLLLEQNPTGVSNVEALKLKLRAYREKIVNSRTKIKILQQRNRRQHDKITKLQNCIKKIKNSESTDEDVSEDDISEDEIFEELLKFQKEVDSDS